MSDNWKDKSTFVCKTCMYYVPKDGSLGRCRALPPSMKGWPAVYENDWCGGHKLDGAKLRELKE